MAWDLLLYVPTVIALFAIGAKLWFGANQSWSYLLVFLGSFFCLVGANRILKTRLLALPSAPVAIELGKGHVRLELRNGSAVDLVKNVRFFSEIGGKTFALTGMDLGGQKRQFVFHSGQFQGVSDYKDAKSYLEVYR